MEAISLEFDGEAEARASLKHLRDKLKVTGELTIKPMPTGVWRLEIYSEKGVRSGTLDKIGGRQAR